MSQSLGIAQAGLPEGDARRLRAMLLLALADGSLSSHWHLGEPASAQVLVTTAGVFPELVPSLPAGTRLVAVLGKEGEAVPPGALKLNTPLTVRALLQLLTQAEQRMAVPAPPEPQEHPLLQLAELIASGHTPDGQAWCVTGLAGAPLYAVPSRRQFFCSEPPAFPPPDSHAPIVLTPLDPQALPEQSLQPRPMMILQWTVGLATGPLGLLSWLDPGAAFSLRAFPEFPVLHHAPVHRRLAAAFARPSCGLSPLAGHLQIPVETVTGFVNAAELCGYLHTAPPNAGLHARRRGVARMKLVQIFRKALGI